MPRTYVVDLDIPPEHLARYYRGEVDAVRAQSVDGLWIQFPARVLRAMVTRQGVRGRFALKVEGTRLVTIRELPGDASGQA